MQTRLCSNPDEGGSAPWTFFVEDGTVPRRPDCASPPRFVGDIDAPGTGCVWDMAVVPVSRANFEVRAARDGLRTDSCVASVWTSEPTEGVRAPLPLSHASFSIVAYGGATSESDRIRSPRPLSIEYTMEPTRLTLTGGPGDRLAVAETAVDVGEAPADSIAISDFTLNVPEPLDHVLYLPAPTRAKVLAGGAWATDDFFTIRACIVDGLSPIRPVDCASAEVFLDRAPPPAGATSGTATALDLSSGDCPADGMPWTLDSVRENFQRGGASTVLLDIDGTSEQTINRSCLNSRNQVVGRISALRGLARYDFLHAYVNGAGRLMRDGAGRTVSTFDGESRVTFFGRDYLGPDRVSTSYRPTNRLFMSRTTVCPSFRYFNFLTFTVEFCGLGAWGFDGLEFDWGTTSSADFTEHAEVREIVGRVTPRALVQVELTGAVSFLGSRGGVRGNLTIIDIGLPMNASVRGGLRNDGRGIDAQFQANAALSFGSLTGTQVTGFADLNYFFGTKSYRWALASSPGAGASTVSLLNLGATALYPTY